MLRGHCLCGDVVVEVDGPPSLMHHCHCGRCRKAHGTPFATYFAAPADGVRLTRGRDRVARWESSPGFFRYFCRGCGSVLPGEPFEGQVFVPAGLIEGDPGARAEAHIFVGSKASWFDVSDDLPRFDAFPPGIDAAPVPDRLVLDPPGNAPRGSCLCGGVRYVVDGTPLRAYHCHCSRCRRARAAAHASNLAVAADGVRFTRGADLLASYKLPDARHFTQVFCRTCGSAVPRVDRERNLAFIPMGSLDDDPGLRPVAHIFVGSKAPWYPIPGELPQHEEYAPTA